jgi:acyl-[acyl carrier protein]--UDP-N-acetylglucosamine O-acyltransferase
MISGGSLVRKDVPPFTKSGERAFVHVLNVGLRRRVYN